jgi:hypothetical protein
MFIIALVQQAATKIQQNNIVAEVGITAAKDATKLDKATTEITQKIKNKMLQEQVNALLSYNVAIARVSLVVGNYNLQRIKTAVYTYTALGIRRFLSLQSIRTSNNSSLNCTSNVLLDGVDGFLCRGWILVCSQSSGVSYVCCIYSVRVKRLHTLSPSPAIRHSNNSFQLPDVLQHPV